MKNGRIFFSNWLEFIAIYFTVFILNDYKFDGPTNPVIIDCGSHIGLSVRYFKRMYPDASIVAIEPNQKTFDLLRKNTLDLKNVSLINAAVSTIEGESDLFISTNKWTWGDSIKSIWQEGLPSIKVKTILLSNLIRQPIDLLKLDIEGAECEVLYEVKNKLHLVKEMIMEFHISPTCPENSFEKTYKLLIDSGFKIRVTKWFRFGIEIKNFSKLPKKTQLVIHAKR